MIRVVLPFHLQTLAKSEREVSLEVDGPVTTHSVLSALETAYPMLRGTVRDHVTLVRRPRVRFYANGEDITHEPTNVPLAEPVAEGREPFMIIGAVSGG